MILALRKVTGAVRIETREFTMKKILLILGLVLLVAACSPHRGYYGNGYHGGHCGYWNSGYDGDQQYRGAGYPAGTHYPSSAYGY